MARISGITLPNNKRIEVGLTYIYGIGRRLSARILKEANVNPNIKVKDLTEDELNRIRQASSSIPMEGDLRRVVMRNVKLLQEIGTYRGTRHKKRLPSRGQRTKTNARTKRGKRVTVGSGKVKLTKT